MNIITKTLASTCMLFSLSFASPFTVDTAHSEVGFSVKHLMISNVKGKFDSFDSEVNFDTKTNTFKKVEATIDVNSVNTDNEKRDSHLKNADFFNASKYPEMKFVMTSYEKNDQDEGKMKGNLTIKGTTKPVVLKTKIGGVAKGFNGETRLGFTLEGKINRKDFGLEWDKVLETGGVVVGDEVKIVVEVEATEK